MIFAAPLIFISISSFIYAGALKMCSGGNHISDEENDRRHKIGQENRNRKKQQTRNN